MLQESSSDNFPSLREPHNISRHSLKLCTTDEPTRLQGIVAKLWPHRKLYLNSVGHEGKQKDRNVGKGFVAEHWGRDRYGREIREGKGDNITFIFKIVTRTKNNAKVSKEFTSIKINYISKNFQNVIVI